MDDVNLSFIHDSGFTATDFFPVPPPIAFPVAISAPAFELSPVSATDKIALDKFFPFRPSLETAHPMYAPPPSRLVSQCLESPKYVSKPVDAVSAFLDLAASPKPPHHGIPVPQSIGVATSPITPALHDLPLERSTSTSCNTLKAFKGSVKTAGDTGAAGTAVSAPRVRLVPSSGVCSVCGKCFFKSGALVRHTRSAHPEVAVVRESRGSSGTGSGGGTGSTSGSSSGGKHPAARLDCPRCPKTFSQQGSLNRHLRSIHEARKLHCRYCDLAFGQAFDLKRHQRRKHPGSIPVVPVEALPRNITMRDSPFCDLRQEG